MIYRTFGKRLIDFLASLTLLIVLAIPLAFLAMGVRLFLGKPVFFRQERPGWKGNIFRMFKFRTMTEACGEDGSLLPDADRMTRFGIFLRRTSLDELPELFNVLKGEMSLVGPRPLILAESEMHEGRRKNGVYTLRPGMTGLSQVNGRDGLSDGEKIDIDTKYLYEFGLMQDVKILAKTLTAVVRGEGNKDKI